MDVLGFDAALPLVFVGLLGIAMLIYVVGDGYDLGVGMLMPLASDTERDVMVASIGPYWDANETWLVLGIGLLLIAFPKANAIISGELYLPIALMLMGLIVRGVAFDFRVKARDGRKHHWNRMFIGGSFVAAVSQGWMLGRYVSGFGTGWNYPVFAAAIALALPMAYVMMGAAWLILKTEGGIQDKAIGWARGAWTPMAVGLVLVSMATPWISHEVRERWFTLPSFIALMTIPLSAGAAMIAVLLLVRRPHVLRTSASWVPFVLLVLVMMLCFLGLAYSIYPWIVIERMDVWHGASSPEALKVILVGVCLTLPAIAAYTVLSYRVFRGKLSRLQYA